jgi:hypothetical protein
VCFFFVNINFKKLFCFWIQLTYSDMLDSVRDLTNQLKLKLMIIENFIPKDEAVRLEQRAVWDEDVLIWRVSFFLSLSPPPSSLSSLLSALCHHSFNTLFEQ